MLGQPPEEWPDLLLFLGDQVYADDSSPATQGRSPSAAATTPTTVPPALDCVADFEEYTWLYHESWSPGGRALVLSVVPSAMIFDDHDMIDDWNISDGVGRATSATKPWWQDHVVGGLMSYWVYQHLGNLAPGRDPGRGDAGTR